MSKFMMIVGILLAAAAIALGLMIYFSVATIAAWGLTPEAAINLLVGGILAIGLGGAIAALDRLRQLPAAFPAAAVADTAIPEFGRRAPPTPESEVSPETSETIRALEQAKTEIQKALGEGQEAAPAASPAVAEAVSPPAEPAAAVPAPEPEAHPEASPDVADDGQLYVLEERTIRGRPARLLSDGTVEAETDEGWMRFENLDHLDEYLDAMQPEPKA